MDPNPDYDASDEIEFFLSYFAWGLRGRHRWWLPASRLPAGLIDRTGHSPVYHVGPVKNPSKRMRC